MNILFFLKNLVGMLLMPLPFSLALIVIGTILLWVGRGRRFAKYAITAGVAALLFFSSPLVGYHLAHGLESRYPPLPAERIAGNRVFAVPVSPAAGKTDTGVRVGTAARGLYIVVLSGGASNDPQLPETDRLTSNSALRVVEAVEIYHRLAASSSAESRANQASGKDGAASPMQPRLILSGGPTLNAVSEAIPMEKLAESLGVPAENIELETSSRDTFSEAGNLAQMIGHQPFILVTSAIHMPRAVALFRHFGMQPVPAPANYLGRRTTEPVMLKLPPNIKALDQSTQAWHEHVGMFWEHLRGQL